MTILRYDIESYMPDFNYYEMPKGGCRDLNGYFPSNDLIRLMIEPAQIQAGVANRTCQSSKTFYVEGSSYTVIMCMETTGSKYPKMYVAKGSTLYDVTDTGSWTNRPSTTWDFALANKMLVATDGFAAPLLLKDITCTQKTITALTRVTTTANATCNGHGLVTGDTINVSGATPSGYNGTFVITKDTDNTFHYTMVSDPGADATGTIKWNYAFGTGLTTNWPTSAKYCRYYNGRLIFGYTTEGGVTYSRRLRWSKISNILDMTVTTVPDSGYNDLLDAGGDITGLEIFGNYLAIGHMNSMTVAMPDNLYVYAFLQNALKTPVLARTMVSVGAILYFWSKTSIYAWGGVGGDPIDIGIGINRWANTPYYDVGDALFHNAVHIPGENVIAWLTRAKYPNQTTAGTQLFFYNINKKNWTRYTNDIDPLATLLEDIFADVVSATLTFPYGLGIVSGAATYNFATSGSYTLSNSLKTAAVASDSRKSHTIRRIYVVGSTKPTAVTVDVYFTQDQANPTNTVTFTYSSRTDSWDGRATGRYLVANITQGDKISAVLFELAEGEQL